jgi:hypothetical protein
LFLDASPRKQPAKEAKNAVKWNHEAEEDTEATEEVHQD